MPRHSVAWPPWSKSSHVKEKQYPTGISFGTFLHHLAGEVDVPCPCSADQSGRLLSAYLRVLPCPDPLCLTFSRLLPLFCSPPLAVSLPHICPPLALYHLERLGLLLFLSRPPASCSTPCPTSSLSPSACCQNSPRHSQVASLSLSLWRPVLLALHLSFPRNSKKI